MKTKAKLPKAFKRKWVAALRSGNYKQCAGVLYCPKKDAYDALGVAYKIAGAIKDVKNKEFPKMKSRKFMPNMITTNEAVIDKITLLNDNGNSFRWMAHYIEEQL